MAELYLAGNEVSITDYGHLQLVYIDDAGNEFEIEVQSPTAASGDWIVVPATTDHTTTPGYGDAENYARVQIDVGPDRTVEEVWQLLTNARDFFATQSIDYRTGVAPGETLEGQNSNSYITALMHIAGLDIDTYLAGATPSDVGSGFPGVARNVLFDVVDSSGTALAPIALTLPGTPGNDVMNGGAGADSLSGLDGNDTLDGNGGADTLNGGPGVDTVAMIGAPEDYEIVSVNAGTRVLRDPAGTETTLVDVERIQFSNGDLTDAALNPLSGSPGLVSGLGGDVGFGENVLPANDDGFTAQIDASAIFEDGINFFGTVYSGFWINNNGSITFGGPRGTYTPSPITDVSNNPEISPYFADVDTRGGAASPTPGGNSMGTNLVYWDFNEVTDQIVITWDDVGYYSNRTDLLNAFQLILTDQGGGDFDIQFRYEAVNWTTGSASGGVNGLGGTVARAGYTAGSGEADEFFELPQSGDQDAMLSLDVIPGNTGLVGLWEFFVRNGGVVESVVPLQPEDAGGWVAGDPHLSTLDGVGYDFQAAGEYVLLRGTESDFEIQARMVPVADNVSVNAAVATNLGGTAVMIDATDEVPLHIGGVPTEIEDFGFVEVGDDRVYREGDTYTVVYAGADGVVGDGDSQLIVTVREDRVDLDIRLNDALLGSLEGLLGDGDGDASNDIALADGTPLARPLVFEDVYGQYRDDWRVTSAEQSLFTYDEGESLAGFYDEDFPGAAVSLDDLDPELLAAAEEAATNAGLTPGTPNFENAVLDFALTGDSSFLESAVEVPQTIDETVATEEPEALVLTGTPGPDALTGGVLGDTIDGLAGQDTIVGRAGDDRLEGGDGRDLIDAGSGDDAVLGQGGDDTLLGGDGNDNIAASDGNDEAHGGAGDDLMGGGLGNDLMTGGAGRDFMGGGLGNDTVDGGDDGDVVNGGGGDDVLLGGAGNDTMGGSFNADSVEGGEGDDDMGGGLGQDTVLAGDGDDSVGGGEGNDSIEGGSGADFLAGGGRDDLIDGGSGADTINGGDGDDTMTGGGGEDVFVWNFFKDGDADVITDFADGVDSLRMVGVENAPGSGLQGKLAALNITDTAGGAQIDYQGHIVLIEGVVAADLGLEDFTFL
ncbi:nidogen-like domain-containing protein [Aestuariicoccus sp. MJ-SS9]|uniref:nidogen-like domain-containing protein n=1 Tax=Aestuariicoccus sp. MJ-SS9 TaxID=3079855 RepID=UPI00290906DD|nr:nidogen-like domain-containing protein [Aestuariicoccus sp. MJ-SS9]MDU8912152.1 nidogen-like domain-containing protein [Aestuariicoccus sp. MJ-SS9]